MEVDNGTATDAYVIGVEDRECDQNMLEKATLLLWDRAPPMEIPRVYQLPPLSKWDGASTLPHSLWRALGCPSDLPNCLATS